MGAAWEWIRVFNRDHPKAGRGDYAGDEAVWPDAISGVCAPSPDTAEHLAVASLADTFDVLVHIRRVSPVRWLP
ncbi:hypothetical protein [Streptomyces halobius]|uniref:Uncharacterized protein n=1 Tax=Streptomyces halobius TaxID=2879846 RepID=A0ABY4MIL1_9ACTN|nr:hypothetical protein [Streptomyces halobius]UQA97398.1 hypothetical protein K9S39_41020 [Streptomyces halobius]